VGYKNYAERAPIINLVEFIETNALPPSKTANRRNQTRVINIIKHENVECRVNVSLPVI